MKNYDYKSRQPAQLVFESFVKSESKESTKVPSSEIWETEIGKTKKEKVETKAKTNDV